MPNTVAEKDRAFIVLIDYQDSLVGAVPGSSVALSRVRLLVEGAAIVGVPVVVTQQYPKGLGVVTESVRSVLDTVAEGGLPVETVDKLSFDCFKEPDFARSVDALGRDQMIVCGFESHICVAQTALAGLRRGLDVHVVGDGCGSRRASDHESAMMRLGLAGATITTAESVCYELIDTAGTPEFKQLLRAVKEACA